MPRSRSSGAARISFRGGGHRLQSGPPSLRAPPICKNISIFHMHPAERPPLPAFSRKVSETRGAPDRKLGGAANPLTPLSSPLSRRHRVHRLAGGLRRQCSSAPSLGGRRPAAADLPDRSNLSVEQHGDHPSRHWISS